MTNQRPASDSPIDAGIAAFQVKGFWRVSKSVVMLNLFQHLHESVEETLKQNGASVRANQGDQESEIYQNPEFN
jgi:hypothetical protein